jgi:hypothetical protein
MQGVNPKAISLQLGDSSLAFTLLGYARFLPGFGDNGANKPSALSEAYISSSSGQERGTRPACVLWGEGVAPGGTFYSLLAPQ